MLAREFVPAATPDPRSEARIAAEFRARVREGLVIRPAGAARAGPGALLSGGYTPKHRLALFGLELYLSRIRQNELFRFFVAYVCPEDGRVAYPRLFYKDSSLVWRAATHYIRSEHENWIGKGDLKTVVRDGYELEYAAEETTNLPFELQAGLDELSRRPDRVQSDQRAIALVLRKAPDDRMAPYRDFSEPRARARRNPRNRVHGGRFVARFERANDPSSLRFVRGYQPDFARGVLEQSRISSRLYGGTVRKYRILSANREIQYQFMAGPHQAWIVPPQTLSTELTSFAVRTIDVDADEDAFVPGYEYHYMDESCDPPRLHSQIPEGFAGAPSEVDPTRADASPWLEKLPVIARFRRRLLGG